MRTIYFIATLLLLASCKKDKVLKPAPQMHYINHNITVGYNELKRLDLDGNGTVDVSFRTYHIGDPLSQMDKIQFCAGSMVESNFPMNKYDDVDIRKNGDWIETGNSSQYEWYQVSLAVLAQKNIGLVKPPYWTGLWKDVQHQYLPIQLVKNNQRYNGWIELSFDQTAEKIIVHRSGVSLVPEENIKAGF